MACKQVKVESLSVQSTLHMVQHYLVELVFFIFFSLECIKYKTFVHNFHLGIMVACGFLVAIADLGMIFLEGHGVTT